MDQVLQRREGHSQVAEVEERRDADQRQQRSQVVAGDRQDIEGSPQDQAYGFALSKSGIFMCQLPEHVDIL